MPGQKEIWGGASIEKNEQNGKGTIYPAQPKKTKAISPPKLAKVPEEGNIEGLRGEGKLVKLEGGG